MAGLAAFAIGYVLSQFFRTFLAVLTPALTADVGVTKTDLSLASGAWFLAFALMQFAVGVWLDRYGPRRTTSILLALGGGSGAVLFAMATTPGMIIAAMALIGIGSSAALMGPVFVFARDYPPARMAVLTSLMVGVGSAGNVAAAAPLANAAEAFGWRPVMLVLGVISVLTAVAVYALVRDPKRAETAPGGLGFGGYLELLKVRALWAIIPLTAVNYAPVVGVRGLWSGPMLADIYGADALLIGRVTLLMALAMVAGNFIYGPLDQIFRTRKWVAFVGCGASLLALVALGLFPQSGVVVVSCLLILLGITGAAYGLLMAHARAFFPPHLTGRGATLMNFFSIGGVGAFQFASGAVVASNFDSADPASAYTALFFFYGVMLAGALIIYLWAKDAPPERAQPT